MHRSIVGSFRSQSTSHSPSPTPDFQFRSHTSASTATDSYRSGHGLRSDTATSVRVIAPNPRILNSIQELERPPAPPFDRTVDLLCIDKDAADPPDLVFEQCLLEDDSMNRQHPLFNLPVNVRRRVYGYCFPDEDRKITLSPHFATKAVFPDDYFASAWDVLEPVSGGISSFRALRNDLMTYFWAEYHFHVTLSPFNGPKFCPLSQVWLLEYLHIVQRLTIESDFTRFSGSALKIADDFGHDTEKSETMLVKVVMGLVKREGKTKMKELNLMCRRYAGFRPLDDMFDEKLSAQKATLYVPTKSLFLCDVLCEMRGNLQQCRMSGFTVGYTELLLSALFSEGDETPDYIIPMFSSWPDLPPPSSASFMSSRTPPSMMAMDFRMGLRLNRSRSFKEEFDDEISKYEASTFSSTNSNYTYDSGLHIHTEDGTTLADHVKKYGTTVQQRPRPSEKYTGAAALATASTPRSGGLGEMIQVTNLLSEPDHSTPAPQSRCATPNSPNTMNQKNEQDPAFQRTLIAIRNIDDIPKARDGPRPQSVEAAPKPVMGDGRPDNGADRPYTSLTNRSQGAKRRYLTFVNKLRGR